MATATAMATVMAKVKAKAMATAKATTMAMAIATEEIRLLLCTGIRYLVIRPSVPISYVLAERVEYIKDIFGRARHRKLARRAGRTSCTPCSSVSRSHS